MLIVYIIIFITSTLYIMVISTQYVYFKNGYAFIIFKLYIYILCKKKEGGGKSDRFGLTYFTDGNGGRGEKIIKKSYGH